MAGMGALASLLFCVSSGCIASEPLLPEVCSEGDGEQCDDQDVTVTSSECTGVTLWSRAFGGAGGDYGEDIAVDGDGNVLLAGEFEGTVDFGSGPFSSVGPDDIFVLKLNAQGQHQWSRRFGGLDVVYFNRIAVDGAGRVLLAGSFKGTVDFGGGPLSSAGAGDIFVVKLNAQGEYLWSRRFGGTGDETARDVTVDGGGNVLLTGYFENTVDFGGGPLSSAGDNDIYVLELNASGQHVWSRRFGAGGQDGGRGITVSSAGNILLTGNVSRTVDLGGGALPGAGLRDVFVLALDPRGQYLWSRRFGGVSYDDSWGIAVDSAGNALVTGHFRGVVDFGGGPLSSAGLWDIFVLALDGQGQHLWSHRFGDVSDDESRSVGVDSAGNVTITGYFQGTADFGGGPFSSAGGQDIFVAKLDSLGQHLWSHRFGGTGLFDKGLGLVVDSAGHALVTGKFSGMADFCDNPLFSIGSMDIFAVKLEP